MYIINLIAIVIIIALATLGIVLFELYKRFEHGYVRGLVVCVAVAFIVGAVIVVAKLISGGLIR